MRARFIFISALGIFFLALLIILSTDTACAASGQPGPCFLFPEGTDWYLGGRGYHNGCEGTNIQCGPIMGYDYIAPLGTPILAPFDGTVTASCHHDGVGNTVFKMVSSDGEWEFGSLHQEWDSPFACLVPKHQDWSEYLGSRSVLGLSRRRSSPSRTASARTPARGKRMVGKNH